MYYEKMIEKALSDGKLKQCITGYGEFAIPSRNELYQNLTDYDMLLDNMDWYNQKHPGKNLKVEYEKTLVEMLSGNIASYIYCATRCILVNIEKEKNKKFGFKLSDKERFLELAKQSLSLNKEEIVEFIDRLFGSQVASQRFYNAVSSEVVENLSTMKM